MSGLTKVEMEFCERVPYELGRIADAIAKIHGVQVGAPEKDKTPAPKNSEFDVLTVTNVEVYPFKEGASIGHVKGLASVIINDQLHLRGLRIMEGMNGLFVGYPTDPFYKGEDLRSMYFPMTRQLREHIENCVLEKYEEAVK